MGRILSLYLVLLALAVFSAGTAGSGTGVSSEHRSDHASRETLLAFNLGDEINEVGNQVEHSVRGSFQQPKREHPSSPEPEHRFPSWCDKASSAVEKAICTDPELADLDAKLNETYGRVRATASADQAKALPTEQRSWLQKRNRCAKESPVRSCLILVYDARLHELARTTAESGNLAANTELDRRRAELREIQRLLAERGYDPGPADGLMGERTRKAILAYQRANRLSVDGEPSAELLTHVRTPDAGDSRPAQYQPQLLSLRGMRIGDTSDDLHSFRFDLASSGKGKDWGALHDEREWHARFVLRPDSEYARARFTKQQGGYLKVLKYRFDTHISKEKPCKNHIASYLSSQRQIYGAERETRNGSRGESYDLEFEWIDDYSILTLRINCDSPGTFRTNHALSEKGGRVLLLEPELRELQERLVAVDLYRGEVNGIMDDRLAAAIRDYQTYANLGPDGLPTKRLLSQVKAHAAIVAQAKWFAASEASAVYERAKRRLAISSDIQLKTLGPDRVNAGNAEIEVSFAPRGPGVLWLFNETFKPTFIGSVRVHQPMPIFRSRWMPFIGKTGDVIAAFEDSEGKLVAGKLSYWVFENQETQGQRDRQIGLLNRILPEKSSCTEGAEFTELRSASLVEDQGIVYLRNSSCDCRNKSTGEVEGAKSCLKERVWSLESGEPLFTESLTREFGETRALAVDSSIFSAQGLVVTTHAMGGESITDHLIAAGAEKAQERPQPGEQIIKLPDRCVRQMDLVAQGRGRAHPIDSEILSNCVSRYRQSLRGADLSQIDLEEFDIKDVDLKGADFSGSNLFGAGFVKADLSGSVFGGADLKNAYFKRTDLRNTSFREADLRKVIFDYGDVAGADFTDANLQGAKFTEVENVDQAIGLSLESTDAVRPGTLTPIPAAATPRGTATQAGISSDGSPIAEQLIAHLGGKRISFQSPAMANQPPMDVSVFVCSNGEFLFKDNLASAPGSIGGSAMRTGRWHLSGQGGQALILLGFSNGEQMSYQAMVRGGITYMNGSQVAVSGDNVLCD